MQPQTKAGLQNSYWTSRNLCGAAGVLLISLALWEGLQQLDARSETLRARQDSARTQSEQLIRTLAPEIEPPRLSAAPPMAFGNSPTAQPQMALRGESSDQKHTFLFLWNERGDKLVMLCHGLKSATDAPEPLSADEGIGIVRYWLRRTGVLGPGAAVPEVTQHPGPAQWLTYRAQWSENTVQVSLDRRSGQLVRLRVLAPGGVGIHPAPVDLAGGIP